MTALSDEEIAFYHREGYLVVKDFIPHELIYNLRDAIAEAIDEQARKLHQEGKLSELHEELDFLHRATELYKQCPDILLPIDGGNMAGPAVFHLMTCPQILDIMEQLLGPEIVSSSVFRVRPKLPSRPESNVPWHQDQGYCATCADEHLVVTCWVPLMNATVETGCMKVIPRSHEHGVLRHYRAETLAPPLTVHPDHLPDTEPVLVPADIGDAVLLTSLTCHRSTPNDSEFIRWSTDLRYNAPEAGNYFPYEANFLARSRKEDVVTTETEFYDLRKNYVPDGQVDRNWLNEADEVFSSR